MNRSGRAAPARGRIIPMERTAEMVGRTVSRFEVLEKLGEGGMGVVYKAVDRKLGRPVALKFVCTERDETARRRFLCEAQAASGIDHPNICTIYDIDETEDGVPFIAMSFYEGETLKSRVGRGPLPIAEAVGVAIQAAEGLVSAHDRNVVHRDIKPANLLITPEGIVKIVDFGLAMLAESTRITRRTSTVGTVAYMSPEQSRGDGVDGRSDLWSLAVVLYEMLSGDVPFRGNDPQSIIYSIRQDEPAPLSSDGRVPRRLEKIVLKALTKDRELRYQTASEMLAALRAFQRVEDLDTPRRAEPGALDSLAVLPFSYLSVSADPEPDHLADGIVEELVGNLARLDSLRVTSTTTVKHYNEAGKTLPEIAEEIGADLFVEGSVTVSAGRVRVAARLIEATTDRILWAGRYVRGASDSVDLESDVARAIARRVRLEVSARRSFGPLRGSRQPK